MPSDSHHIIAVDPGREKLGLAILDMTGEVVEKMVVMIADVPDALQRLTDQYHPDILAVGDGTGCDDFLEKSAAFNFSKIIRIPEKNTTLEARELAWKENPPGGVWRVLPRLFWPSPPDLDAWAAVIIGRRALSQLNIISDRDS
jgi:hypothetical protein